jgi:hypothetical protein
VPTYKWCRLRRMRRQRLTQSINQHSERNLDSKEWLQSPEQLKKIDDECIWSSGRNYNDVCRSEGHDRWRHWCKR